MAKFVNITRQQYFKWLMILELFFFLRSGIALATYYDVTQHSPSKQEDIVMYRTTNDVIQRANSMGSSAATFASAARYILSHTVPMWDRNRTQCPVGWNTETHVYNYEWVRHCSASADWKQWPEMKISRRADRACQRLGLWPRDEAEALADELNKPLLDYAENHLRRGWPYRCLSGTVTYAQRIWDDVSNGHPCAIRADVLLQRRDDIYTRRAIIAAATR